MKGIQARIWLRGRFRKGWLAWEKGKLIEVREGSTPKKFASRIDNYGEARILPGFVDTLVHGFAGIGAATHSAIDLDRMARGLARAGVTSALAGFYPLSLARLRGASKRWTTCKKLRGVRTRFTGWHVEGLFINPEMAGALPKEGLLTPDEKSAERFVKACGGWLKMSTIAPEVPGALDAAEVLREAGVLLSIGHSAAEYIDCEALHANGPVAMTHLGNRVLPMTAREPGPIGFAMEGNADFVAAIPDAIHVSPEMLRLWARTPSMRTKLMAVSDNLSHAGLPAESFDAGGQEAHRDGPVARNKRDELCGTLDSLPELLMRRVRDGVLSMAQAVRMGCEVPGKLIGDCGRLETGFRADLVELKKDSTIGAIWVGGRKA
jgi:N-acetylglucosamine-6-phosphate deacetylase